MTATTSDSRDEHRPFSNGDQSDAGPEDTSTSRELSLDTTFELLKNRRRRKVLEYLRTNGGESTLSDLAEHIAAIENDVEVDQLSSDQRKRVYIGLYQSHLPKLDGVGVVDYDKNRGTVVLREPAREVLAYLEAEPVDGEDHDSSDTGRVRETAVSSTIAAGLGAAGLQVAGVIAGLSISSVLALVVGAALVSLVAAIRGTVLGRGRCGRSAQSR
jgi:hypothetical protein